MTSVLILGGTGMLGSMVADVLSRDTELSISATVRRPDLLDTLCERMPHVVGWRGFDADATDSLTALVRGQAWVVNAIGVTKPLIDENDADSVERAIRVNSLFPHALACACSETGSFVLQIATDCVFAGDRGRYTEDDAHDCLDIYGKTKSLGEAAAGNVVNLRSSIIGPEPKDFKFLLEWLRRQPPGSRLSGFRNHLWNGVTTYHYAKICGEIIKSGNLAATLRSTRAQHLVPGDDVTKMELLKQLAAAYRTSGVVITETDALSVVDRTLETSRSEVNRTMWRVAGYAEPPTIAQMVSELARFDLRFPKMAPGCEPG